MAIASAAVNALFTLVYLTRPVTAQVSSQIHIKVTPGTDPNIIRNHVDNVNSLEPLFTLPRERLKKLSEAKPGLPDLTLWYRAEVEMPSSGPEEEAKIKADLDAMDSIVNVIFPKTPDPPTVPKTPPPPAVTPDFVLYQGYLGPNTDSNNGIDAEKSWRYPGGNGEGITIYDVEYGWLQTHEDLGVVSNIDLLLNPGDTSYNPFSDDHGTAVLGEMVGDMNGFGVKGISYGASVGLAPEYTLQQGSARGNAIMLAVDDGKAGDVILLEMQTWACGGPDYGPAEDDQDVFDATVVAVANGITVVAAAGNGNVDLDSPSCGSNYDRDFRDSGAIIVGAGSSGMSGIPREKLSYSTYGSRVDVQGWGYDVFTTAYGYFYKDPDDTSDENKWYTSSFSGTSSASPFVAATVANIQGIALQEFGSPLDPLEIRTLLTNTGLPQQGVGGNIGPLVNLGLAIDSLSIPDPPTQAPTPKPPTQAPTVCTGEYVTVELTTDTYPGETSWTVTTKNEGRVVMQNGFLAVSSLYITTSCLDPDCYVFEIRDTYGDGICCQYGQGSFSVTVAGNNVFSGGAFDDSASEEFCVGGGPTCADSGLPISTGEVSVSCAQVPASACENALVASHCPLSCDACEEYGCKNTMAPFASFTCDQLAGADPGLIADVCDEYDVVATTCREVCDFCTN